MDQKDTGQGMNQNSQATRTNRARITGGVTMVALTGVLGAVLVGCAGAPAASTPAPEVTPTPAASCARSVEFEWVDRSEFADLPTLGGFAERAELPFVPRLTTVPGYLGYPSATWIDEGLALARSGTDQPDGASDTFRLFEMPAGEERWRFDLPSDTEEAHTWIHAPAAVVDQGVIIVVQSAPSSTTLTARSLEDGEELSRVDLAAGAAIVTDPVLQSPDFEPLRELLHLSSDGRVLAVAPDRLDEPVWDVAGEWASGLGDVILIDQQAYDQATGVPLGWSGQVAYEGEPDLFPLGGLLFRMSEERELTPLDPRTGEPCGPAVPADSAYAVESGFLTVSADGAVASFDREGEPTGSGGTITAGWYPTLLAGRPAQTDGAGQYEFLPADGPVLTLDPIGPVIGHDGERIFVQAGTGGPVTAVDISTGEIAWQSESVTPVQHWGGSMVRLLMSPDRYIVTVAQP